MREYLLICVVAAAITFLATPAIRWAAVRFGAVTPVRGRDVHSIPVPRLGGVAMLVGFLAAAAVASQLPYLSGLYDEGELFGVLIGARHGQDNVLLALAADLEAADPWPLPPEVAAGADPGAVGA